MRLGLGKGNACVRTHKVLGIMVQLPGLLVHYRQGAFPEIECRHDRIADSFGVFCRRFQPVYHKFYEMWLVPVHHRGRGEIAQVSVYSDLGVSFAPELFEEFLVMTLSSSYQWSEKIAFLPVIVFQYQRHYLLVGVPHHFLACGRRVGLGCLCIQQPQEIVYFGDGPHC